MKRLLLAGIAVAALAAGPSAITHWKASDLKGYGAKLAPKMNELKLATEQIGNFGNHSLMAVHREGNGEAEIHEKQADIFIVQSGTASFVSGGTVEQPKATAPGEIRGPSIKGGKTIVIGPGDVVHVPARLPHQVLVKPGTKFTYLIVKVDTP